MSQNWVAGARCALSGLIAALLLAAGPAVAAGRDGKEFQAFTTGMVILKPIDPPAIGSERTVKEGDVVFRAPLGWFHHAVSDQDITARIIDLDWTIPKGSFLQSVAGMSGGNLSSLPKTAKTYCDAPKQDTVKGLMHSLTLGLSQLGARIAKETRLCVIDSDGNGDFDKAFLVGLKKKEDRFVVDIAPVPYTPHINAPMGENSFMEVVFYDGGMLNGANFQIRVSINGQMAGLSGIRAFAPAKPTTLTYVNSQQDIKSKKLPYPMTFGPAQLTVTALDKLAKTATIRVDRNLSWTPLIPVYPPQVIYVYY